MAAAHEQSSPSTTSTPPRLSSSPAKVTVTFQPSHLHRAESYPALNQDQSPNASSHEQVIGAVAEIDATHSHVPENMSHLSLDAGPRSALRRAIEEFEGLRESMYTVPETTDKWTSVCPALRVFHVKMFANTARGFEQLIQFYRLSNVASNLKAAGDGTRVEEIETEMREIVQVATGVLHKGGALVKEQARQFRELYGEETAQVVTELAECRARIQRELPPLTTSLDEYATALEQVLRSIGVCTASNSGRRPPISGALLKSGSSEAEVYAAIKALQTANTRPSAFRSRLRTQTNTLKAALGELDLSDPNQPGYGLKYGGVDAPILAHVKYSYLKHRHGVPCLRGSEIASAPRFERAAARFPLRDSRASTLLPDTAAENTAVNTPTTPTTPSFSAVAAFPARDGKSTAKLKVENKKNAQENHAEEAATAAAPTKAIRLGDEGLASNSTLQKLNHIRRKLKSNICPGTRLNADNDPAHLQESLAAWRTFAAKLERKTKQGRNGLLLLRLKVQSQTLKLEGVLQRDRESPSSEQAVLVAVPVAEDQAALVAISKEDKRDSGIEADVQGSPSTAPHPCARLTLRCGPSPNPRIVAPAAPFVLPKVTPGVNAASDKASLSSIHSSELDALSSGMVTPEEGEWLSRRGVAAQAARGRRRE